MTDLEMLREALKFVPKDAPVFKLIDERVRRPTRLEWVTVEVGIRWRADLPGKDWLGIYHDGHFYMWFVWKNGHEGLTGAKTDLLDAMLAVEAAAEVR